MQHSFDTRVAKEVGVNAASVLHHIFYWCEKNRANGKNEHEGLWWTYSSVQAFCEMFDYLTEKQIRLSLKKLEEYGYIKTGNYNKIPYDRTKWYAVTKEVYSIYGKEKIDLPKKENEKNQKGEPIPDTSKDTSKDILKEIYKEKDEFQDEKAQLCAETLTAFNELTKSTLVSLSPKDFFNLEKIHDNGRTIDDIRTVISHKFDEWKGDSKMSKFVRPSTLFGDKFEEYLQESKNHKAIEDEYAIYDSKVEVWE